MLFVRHGKFIVISLIDNDEKGPFVRCDVDDDGKKVFQLDYGAKKIQGNDPVLAKVKTEPEFPELYFKATIKDNAISDVELSHHRTVAALVVPYSDKQRQPVLFADGIFSEVVDGTEHWKINDPNSSDIFIAGLLSRVVVEELTLCIDGLAAKPDQSAEVKPEDYVEIVHGIVKRTSWARRFVENESMSLSTYAFDVVTYSCHIAQTRSRKLIENLSITQLF